MPRANDVAEKNNPCDSMQSVLSVYERFLHSGRQLRHPLHFHLRIELRE